MCITDCNNSTVESENEDNRGINEETENENEGNEAREVVMRDVSDSEDSNTSSNDDESDETWSDVAKLRQWAIQSHIPHCHLDSLLRILRRQLIPNLPATSKTFLKTKSANYQIKEFRSSDGTIIGEFVYFGIAVGLQRCVNKEGNIPIICSIC